MRGHDDDSSGFGLEQSVELRFPPGMKNGVMHVEVVRGGMVSACKVWALSQGSRDSQMAELC